MLQALSGMRLRHKKKSRSLIALPCYQCRSAECTAAAQAHRRSGRVDVGDAVTFDGITVNFAKMEVVRDGHLVELTAREFNALKFLVQNPERVISRDELLSEVWGYQNYPTTRTVDNHILKLRQKLEKDPTNPVHFRTVHGVGYKFVR